jgi:hypothetical protein
VGKTIPRPYRQEGSIIAQAFAMCERGTSITGLMEFVKRRGGNGIIILRVMRRGHTRGCCWRVQEKGDYIRIFYPA